MVNVAILKVVIP